MIAKELRCEFLSNPIGIDVVEPRLTWTCAEGKKQSAYEIIFYKNGLEFYKTGKVNSSSMNYIFKQKLDSRDIIDLKIRLYDENDKKGEWSLSASFEIGLLHKEDWKASFITGNYKVNKKKRYPVDCFKKTFTVKDISKARLYITALGLYVAYINGKRVGEFILAPGSTDYNKRLQYQVYDVTTFLNEGENTLEIQLADGWYRGSNGAKGITNTYGSVTKVLSQLEIYNKEGKKEEILSDGSFKWSNYGEKEFADLKDGEIVDFNRKPSYNSFSKVSHEEHNLTCSENYQIKEMEHIKPIEMFNSETGKTILKFPQNFAGYISFRINAKKGEKIDIVLGEILDEKKEVTLKNVQCIRKGKRTPLQEFHITLKEGINEYTPSFFYGGFQYMMIDTKVKFSKDDFTAIALYSQLPVTSSFECSHPLINQLYKNTLWSLRSNSADIPTDCPTRERMGWTGDSQIFFNTASYLTDYAPFARKHIADIYDRQWKSGKLPQIAPFANEDWFMWVMNGSVGWACSGVNIPLYYYKKYGDKRILENNYEGMLKYAKFMISRAGKWGGVYAKPMHMSHKNRKYAVNCGQSYGEWAEPNDVKAFIWTDFATPHPEESTAYTYFTLKRVLEVAKILNKPEDKFLKKIKEYSEGAKIAYRELVTKKGHTLDTNRQAKLVRPLYMGLLDEKQEAYAKTRLIQALDFYKWRLGTGFLSTPMILYVLKDIDIKYAYRLLENEDMPGWLFMPKSGATTIWEGWEGTKSDKGIASLNHYSKVQS